MRALAVSALLASGVMAAGAVGPAAATQFSERLVSGFSERLVGGNENPPVVSDGSGRFVARSKHDLIRFVLRYKDLTEVTQAHIHIANPGNNGGVTAFLCSNLEGAPPGVGPCPPAPAVVRGEIAAQDVREVTVATDDPAEPIVVLEAEDFKGLIRLIRQGATYVNVHTMEHPGGEIRGQINPRRR